MEGGLDRHIFCVLGFLTEEFYVHVKQHVAIYLLLFEDLFERS